MKERKKIMEIIHDAYNKNMKCPNCESTFRYNEKDIESIFPCPEMAEQGIETLKKARGLGYAFYHTGKVVRCPLCGAIVLIDGGRFFGRK